jgi:hypothetical protein
VTREEFIEILDKKGYSYEIQGDRIVVTHKGDVFLNALTSLPPGVVFENERLLDLGSLISISPGVVFRNGGYVGLNSLTSLSPGVEFRNKGSIILGFLSEGFLDFWKGNIDGIDSKRLLNYMISKGIFER